VGSHCCGGGLDCAAQSLGSETKVSNDALRQKRGRRRNENSNGSLVKQKVNALAPETTPPARRLTSLDAVRGIASFIVILCHCNAILPDAVQSQLDSSILSRPIALFTNGAASVIIFFVLSGYVLALPFFHGTQPNYSRYVFRRFCRIYIPFAVAICIAALLCRITNERQSLDGLAGRI